MELFLSGFAVAMAIGAMIVVFKLQRRVEVAERLLDELRDEMRGHAP